MPHQLNSNVEYRYPSTSRGITVPVVLTNGISRNLLGQHGWLEQIRMGLIDHDEILYVSPYNE